MYQPRSTVPCDAPMRFPFFRFDVLFFFYTPEIHLRRSGKFDNMRGRHFDLREPTGAIALVMRG
jgi:hypothetical protein